MATRKPDDGKKGPSRKTTVITVSVEVYRNLNKIREEKSRKLNFKLSWNNFFASIMDELKPAVETKS